MDDRRRGRILLIGKLITLPMTVVECTYREWLPDEALLPQAPALTLSRRAAQILTLGGVGDLVTFDAPLQPRFTIETMLTLVEGRTIRGCFPDEAYLASRAWLSGQPPMSDRDFHETRLVVGEWIARHLTRSEALAWWLEHTRIGAQKGLPAFAQARFGVAVDAMTDGQFVSVAAILRDGRRACRSRADFERVAAYLLRRLVEEHVLTADEAAATSVDPRACERFRVDDAD